MGCQSSLLLNTHMVEHMYNEQLIVVQINNIVVYTVEASPDSTHY